MNIFDEVMERNGRDKVSDKLKKPLKLLFVCSGNICRSAYADFAFKKMVDESDILRGRIEVKSGGLSFRNEKIDPRTTKVLVEEGLDEAEVNKHIPKHKDDYPEIFEEADIIIGMTNSHKLNTPKQYRKGDGKKFEQLSKLAIDERIDIGDPYWAKTDEDYKEILVHVRKYLEIIKEKLENYISSE